jgi:hypothetical protein
MPVELYPGWRAMARPLVPDDFEVPAGLTAPAFRLEALGEQHNEGDYAAWTSSIDHVRGTPGFVGWSWPPPEGMSLEDNLGSVCRHARHAAARVGFAYAVLEPGTGEVIGCVYLYPAQERAFDCELRSWVRADRAHLDAPLHEAMVAWLARDWPFRAVLSHARP